jgi:hypothetical protein
MDPNFYTAIMVKLADPAKTMRWMAAGMDMKRYQPRFNAMNPAVSLKFMTEGMNLSNCQAVIKLADPAAAIPWATVAADPKTYNVWAQFADPATFGNMTTAFNPTAFIRVPAVPAAAKSFRQHPGNTQ